jgi:hypothetical protein
MAVAAALPSVATPVLELLALVPFPHPSDRPRNARLKKLRDAAAGRGGAESASTTTTVSGRSTVLDGAGSGTGAGDDSCVGCATPLTLLTVLPAMVELVVAVVVVVVAVVVAPRPDNWPRCLELEVWDAVASFPMLCMSHKPTPAPASESTAVVASSASLLGVVVAAGVVTASVSLAPGVCAVGVTPPLRSSLSSLGVVGTLL